MLYQETNIITANLIRFLIQNQSLHAAKCLDSNSDIYFVQCGLTKVEATPIQAYRLPEANQYGWA